MNRWIRLFWVMGSALLFTIGVGHILLRAPQAVAGQAETTAVIQAISRPQDPVVISGTLLPAFLGTPVDELVAYAFDGSWQAIPFQVDEKDITGTYVLTEDGFFDANDELVFMGKDAGTQSGSWVNDNQARANTRYVVAVSDPLVPSDSGFVYLYHSTTLPRSADSYVSWDQAGQTLTAVDYSLSFASNFLGIANMTINGNGVDILDRQKIRVAATLGTFPIQFPLTANEETLVSTLGIPSTISLTVIGPVRAVGGTGTASFAFYNGRVDVAFPFDLSDTVLQGLPAHFDNIRLSFDLNDPAASGMSPATHTDSNVLAGVTINGTPDSVPSTPPVAWYQNQGALGGFVSVVNVDPGNGTLTNYYKDDSTVSNSDTGDQRSYGDMGFIINEPTSGAIGPIFVRQNLYITLPGAGSVGSAVKEWVDNPLTFAATAETFGGTPHTLTVSKSTRTATAAPGNPLTYTLTVTHSHPTSATSHLWLTDTLPSGTTLLTATTPYTLSGRTIAWGVPTLAANATWQAQLVVQVPLTATGGVINAAYGVQSDEVTAVAGAPLVTSVEPFTLTVSKSGPAFTAPGAPLTYTLTAHNSHSWATTHALWLSDTLPTGATFVTATQPYTLAGNVVTWQTAVLDSGQNWQVNLVVQAPLTGTDTLTNSLYGLRSTEASPVTGIPVVTHIQAYALEVGKTAPAIAYPGDLITYTLHVTNPQGLSLQHALVLSDVLPVGTGFITATQPFTMNGGLVTWQAAQLDSGQVWQVVLVVQVANEPPLNVVNAVYGVRSAEVTAVAGLPVTTQILRRLFLPIMLHP